MVPLLCSACLFTFDRDDEVDPGTINGVALRADDVTQAAERAAYARVSTDSLTLRAAEDGRFALGPLPTGGWAFRVEDDEDGDGWPDRATLLHARISVQTHPTGLFGDTEDRLIGVDLGSLALPGTFALRGSVELHPALEELTDVTRVLAVRDLCPPAEGSAASSVEEMTCPALDGPPPAGRIPLGAEAENAVDASGAFEMRSLATGSLQLVAFAHEVDASGAAGRVVGLSRAVGVVRGDEAELVLPEAIQVLPADPSARRAVRIRTAPAVLAATLVRVPASRPPPPCPEAVAVETSFDPPFAYATAHPLVSTADVVKGDVPTGIWDLYVCADDGRGALFGQVLLPLLPDEQAPALGPVVLSAGPECGEPRDCDRDGRVGLPPLAVLDVDAADEAVWRECGPTCASENRPQECETGEGTFDCDDDADGQADVTEGRACYGPGLGTDWDADDLCSGTDPWPWCAANDESECTAGDYDADPPNRFEGEPVDAGPPLDSGPPADAGVQTVVDGDRQIASAADLAALAGVEVLNGNLTLSGTDLADLSALGSLREVGGALTLSDNTQLTSLAALGNLETVRGKLEVRDNPLLEGLDGLTSLDTVEGDLEIVGNDELTTLGLTSLRDVQGRVLIYFNDKLTTLAGMPALETVDGMFVYFNPKLAAFDLDRLPAIDGDLHLVTNARLASLPALTELTTLTDAGDLTISDNDALTDLSGLVSLSTLDGDLYLYFNDTLATVSLPALTAVGGDLTVLDHAALTTLDLPQLSTVGGRLEIVGNGALPTCQADAVAAGLTGSDGGAVTISGNLSPDAGPDAGACP